MKVLSNNGLEKLIQLSKDEFVSKTDSTQVSTTYTVQAEGVDTELATLVTLADVATSGSYTDLVNAPTTFTGATSGTAGTSGLVVQPLAGDQGKFLKGDGTWATVSGGTSDYTDLNNKPSINSVTLSGNQTSANLGLQDELISGTNIKTINSTSILGSGDITIDSLPSQTSQSGKFLTTNGTSASWADIPTEIPSQTGNNGKYLTTNGSAVSWATVDALPSQTSQSGKFLTTNGTTASWANVPSTLPSQTGQSGKYLTTDGTDASWVTLSIPTVDQTYNASSSNAQSGTAVASAISTAISTTYKAAGSTTFANKPALSSSIEGNVYNVTDSFTTTSDFVEGAGNTYPAGTNIVCINTTGTTYKWDVLAGFIDLSGYQTTITGGATTITSSNLTTSRALVSNSSGKVAVSTVTATELGYVSGVTSGIQSQLNDKLQYAVVITDYTS